MTTTPANPPAADAVLDRAVMVITRRGTNFAPELITVTLHTTNGSTTIEGKPHGPTVPAPNWPELALPTYTFHTPHTGLQPTTDLPTFLTTLTDALEHETAHPDGRLIIAVHTTVLGNDLDDAFAWRYDHNTNGFEAIPATQMNHLFHEDTRLRAAGWDNPPYPSVSALAPAPETTTTPPKPEPSTDGWLCPNHPFGHRFDTPPFPNNRTRCGNCGASPTE